MTQENYYKGIKHIVRISTDENIACEECKADLGRDNFPDAVNHYMDQHDYKILHVGAETSIRQEDSAIWHLTVALLGK